MVIKPGVFSVYDTENRKKTPRIQSKLKPGVFFVYDTENRKKRPELIENWKKRPELSWNKKRTKSRIEVRPGWKIFYFDLWFYFNKKTHKSKMGVE